ncbi:hypothetical protein KEM55_001205 [Ascosphaera atra]|nr:hypothetical protein KEM55_001205 [Ascosphaera atra]
MPLPVSILRASLLRSGSTGLGLRPPPATITTRRWSSQYHRARIALSRPSGCAQCQIRRFYSNGSGSGGNGGNKDANVDAKTREDQRKKEEEERVIYYQPPPEGYEQQQPQHAGRQTDTADANAPQQHEAERPKEAGVEGLDPTTVGIGSTHGGANGIGKDGNTQAEGGSTEHDINLRTDGEEKESRRDTAAYTGYDRSALADQLATGINTNTGTDTGPNANESTAKSTPSSPGSDDGTGPHPGRLPSELQQRRSELTKKFEKMMDNMQSNIFMAGQTLNDLTGYSEIERLKQEIIKQGASPHHSNLLTSKPR